VDAEDEDDLIVVRSGRRKSKDRVPGKSLLARTLFEEQRDAARRRHASPTTSSEASTDVEPKLHTAAAVVASTTAFAPATQQEAAIRKWADVVTQNVALHDETAARVSQNVAAVVHQQEQRHRRLSPNQKQTQGQDHNLNQTKKKLQLPLGL
jgi:hypothetical protein